MSNLVQRQEEQGWVRREADPADSRASLISLTEAGYAELQSARRQAGAALATRLAQLPATDLSTLEAAITEAVMAAAPVERGTASAAYSFVRFSSGAVAPWLAGKLGEEINIQLPFYVGAFAVVLAVGVLATGWKPLSHLRTPTSHSKAEAEALTTADA